MDGYRPLAAAAFELAFAPARRFLLRGPLIAGPLPRPEPGRPVLLVANHCSWWDGFLLRDVQRTIRPGARFFTLMTERELARYPWFRWMGCVGIEPGDPVSGLRAFRRLRDEARRDRAAVFAFFPQGSIWPTTRRPLRFRRGVSLLASLIAPVTIVPVALHLEPLNHAAPTAFVALGEEIVDVDGTTSPECLERAVGDGLDAIRTVLDDAGEDAVRRWPGPGLPLPAPQRPPASPGSPPA